jgi:hypothetical protein
MARTGTNWCGIATCDARRSVWVAQGTFMDEGEMNQSPKSKIEKIVSLRSSLCELRLLY